MLRKTSRALKWILIVSILFLPISVGADFPDGTAIFQKAEDADAGDDGDDATPPTPPADAPPVGQSDTDVEIEKIDPEKLEGYEKDLDMLKERIFKSKSRLMQLYEQLKLGSVSLVGLSVKHTHKVGSTFKLESITYTLDGFEVYAAENDQENSLEKLQDTPVYEGSLLPGDHLLVVDMVFRGKGYGVFSYLNQYLFKVKSRYTFNVVEGDVVNLQVISYDKGSFLTPLKNRLQVSFEKE